MIKVATLVTMLFIMSLTFVACSSDLQTTDSGNEGKSIVTEDHQKQITIVSGGYGYEVGDIILIDTKKEPELGDIVQYNADTNNSMCLAWGPGRYLAKIIGSPGDDVSFQQWSYKANGYEITLERYYEDSTGRTHEHWPWTKQVIWDIEKFDNISSMTLKVPEGEYLADKWIGHECPGELDETHSSKTYNRFTVKQEAITGIIVEKLGHDKEFEERAKRIIY